MTGPQQDSDAAMVRDLYLRHEDLIEGSADRLIPGVVRRRRKRRIAGRSAVGAALALVIGVVAGLFAFMAPGTIDHGPPPAGFKWERASGIQVAVPLAWAVTEADAQGFCGAAGQPTIVLPIPGGGPNLCEIKRGGGGDDTADIAFVTTAHVRLEDVLGMTPYGVTPQPVRIDGVPALRESGQVGLGGPAVYEGFVIIASRDVSVVVRTADATTLAEILDSVHLLSR